MDDDLENSNSTVFKDNQTTTIYTNGIYISCLYFSYQSRTEMKFV